jgi:hypothetical protein
VDRQFELHYAQQYSWDEFVAINLKACSTFQAQEHFEREVERHSGQLSILKI